MKLSKSALKKQKKVFLALIGGVVMLVLGVMYSLLSDQKYIPTAQPKPQIDLPGDKLNPQDIWMNRVDSQNALLDQKIKYLEEIILQTKKQEAVVEKEKNDMQQEISHLRNQLKIMAEAPPRENIAFQDPLFAPPSEMSSLFPFSPLVELCIEEPPQLVGNVAHSIPTGTTVKALLVSSVDADCGTYSSSDPIPVKLRLLDCGHLPHGVDVNLKGAIIIGSAFGNLSSERVYMRLERLTQVHPDGRFIETEVAGYVSGEDGKYGVRGSVVDKSVKIIKNAAISGLFGEAGQVLQSALANYRIGNYLNSNQTTNSPMMPGAVGSTSNAFDMLADYYIKRAEHVKPVIQVNAGRIVDITFTHGAELGDLHTQDKIKELRERNRCYP